MLLISLFALFATAISQPAWAGLASDSSEVEVRQLPEERLEEILANEDYLYDRIPPDPETWWDRFKRSFWDSIQDLFTNDPEWTWMDLVRMLLIAGFIFLIVYFLTRGSGSGLFFGKRAKAVDLEHIVLDEDIHELDFDGEISKALDQKDYRRAARLHFLRLLKLLTDKELIEWSIDKTHKEYYLELVDKQLRVPFRESYTLFEYIWYGDFDIERDDYDKAVVEFETFRKRI